jgi:hypothetical protein
MRSGNNYQDKMFLLRYMSLLRAYTCGQATSDPLVFFPWARRGSRFLLGRGIWLKAARVDAFSCDLIPFQLVIGSINIFVMCCCLFLSLTKTQINNVTYIYVYGCQVVVRLGRLINFLQSNQKKVPPSTHVTQIA